MVRMLRTLGTDLVAMSSALEAIAARQMGAEILGPSLVTNLAAGMEEGSVSPEAIIGIGVRRAPGIGRLIAEIVRRL